MMHQTLPTLTVSQLTNAIKHLLESSFTTVSIQGEISNFKVQTSGHIYFSLKDENACISCVCFKQDACRIDGPLKDGLSVTVKGSVTVYSLSGKYQLLVKEVKKTGIGELLLKLEELKKKLLRQGWFKQERKKKLPAFPKRVGIVTSPTGAAIQDMLKVLKRRFAGLHIFLNPVKVQGDGAAIEIAKAINEFNRYDLVDVIIVGRGGGSIEDLFAFNEECVAEAIYNSKIPIICAVGHETDHCIAEYVADVRAPTPSAAAEMIVAEKSLYLKSLKEIRKRIESHVKLKIKRHREHFNTLLKQPTFKNPKLIISFHLQRMDEIEEALNKQIKRVRQLKRIQLKSLEDRLATLKPTTRFKQIREKKEHLKTALSHSIKNFLIREKLALEELEKKLNQTIAGKLVHKKLSLKAPDKFKQIDQNFKRIYQVKKTDLMNCQNTLEAINPKKLLGKGYTILFSEKDGSVIKSVQTLQEESLFHLLLSDGKAEAKFKKIIDVDI